MLCRVYRGCAALGVRDWLKLNGIEAFLRPIQDDGASYEWASVWVLAADETAARSLLVEPEPFSAVERSGRCPTCGRSLDICWCASDVA